MANLTSIWPSEWPCTPQLFTLNGTYIVYHTQTKQIRQIEALGTTIVNGCTERITANARMLAPAPILDAFGKAPFYSTITPLLFSVAATSTLSYALFATTILAHSRRPWLQRLAALSCLISLTMTASYMWDELQSQYYAGRHYDADDLRDVRTTTALKVVRIIANVFLWVCKHEVACCCSFIIVSSVTSRYPPVSPT